jgi:hypothetical protein
MLEMKKSNNDRKYHVWQCVKRGYDTRPGGHALTDGCGLWQVKSSKHHTLNRSVQGNCILAKCARKPRLNPTLMRIYSFDDLETALQFADDKNEDEMTGEEE